MFKTFIAGILLGMAGTAAALYYIPLVDQYREQSLIAVHPNHGNTEAFHVNVPADRIMIGAAAQATPLPPGLDWPEDPAFANTRSEIFKLRNSNDVVVGVASRMAAEDAPVGSMIEWVLHLPARGSVYVAMEPEAREGGYRVGQLTAGTREFGRMIGQVTEQWIADSTGFDDSRAGRIQLITAFVGVEDEE